MHQFVIKTKYFIVVSFGSWSFWKKCTQVHSNVLWHISWPFATLAHNLESNKTLTRSSLPLVKHHYKFGVWISILSHSLCFVFVHHFLVLELRFKQCLSLAQPFRLGIPASLHGSSTHGSSTHTSIVNTHTCTHTHTHTHNNGITTRSNLVNHTLLVDLCSSLFFRLSEIKSSSRTASVVLIFDFIYLNQR